MSESKQEQITEAAFEILERIGVSGAPKDIRKLALDNRAAERPDGRITFPRALADDMIAKACKKVKLPGFNSERGIEAGPGGAAVQVLEADSRAFRGSTLNDLFRLMRTVDASDGIQP